MTDNASLIRVYFGGFFMSTIYTSTKACYS